MNSFESHITVATLVEDAHRFLLVHEWQNNELVLNQPAGHVEANESLVQAAFRETLEESAWQVDITHYLGLYIFQPCLGGGVYYRHCFIAKPVSHDPNLRLDAGIEEALWLTAEEIQNRRSEHRSPLVSQCLKDYLSGRRLPLDTVYQHPWPLQQR
jgi:8-oxo-dGTP pyrophosphatase MutT (NUDIX family)